ncbi:hypothetical protein LZD49_28630 [Dyadobacter sp. CY261]|uniref:hypothetical protein n=1 Tax=Dyadobacter sp. CY261 TaxID=2907203 RepID=UPI001F452FAC|nr:hypothetical protein [Dyadobacter sp. CY261]MCF0074485.1 hypothetical protein [Dyadobacter sp. CY261]
MKASIKQIQNFLNAAAHFVDNHPQEEQVLKTIERIAKRLQPFFQEYHEAKYDIELGLANTDKNGSLLYDLESDGKRFSFTKENMVIVRTRLKALLNDKRFEFEPIIIEDFPVDLREEYKDFFQGFLIKNEDEQPAS